MTDEITDYIDRLNISDEEKQELKIYYAKVWSSFNILKKE
jgi:hypothetical protein